MLWKGKRQSDNFEDAGRNGRSVNTKIVGGGIGGLLILIVIYFLGGDPNEVLHQFDATHQVTEEGNMEDTPERKEAKEFTRVVLAYTEDVWRKLFTEMGREYQNPTLVAFIDGIESACGAAGSATGPFYCPGDQKVYIDLSFYNMLKTKLNSPGDFAMAYVIAHEVGHHVQNLLGISEQVHAMRSTMSDGEYNKISVKLELQADFLAGVWAHHAQQMKGILQEGDIEEALNAAHEIGDDRLQQKSSGHIVPDAFTHGTSKQRMYWFKKGYETGDINEGDTFNTKELQD